MSANNTLSSALSTTNANAGKGKTTKNSKAVKDTNVVKNNNATKDTKAIPAIPKVNVKATTVNAPVVPTSNFNATAVNTPVISASNTNVTSLAPPDVPLTEKTDKKERARRLAAGEKFEKTPFDIATDETATEIAVPAPSTWKDKGQNKGKNKGKVAASLVTTSPDSATSVATTLDVTVEAAPASEPQDTTTPDSKETSESGSTTEDVATGSDSEHSNSAAASEHGEFDSPAKDKSAPPTEDERSTSPAKNDKAASAAKNDESGSSSEDASHTPPQDAGPSRQAQLIAKGVAGPRSAKNKNKKRNRKALDKTAKKDHAIVNPLLQTIAANKDKNEACRDTFKKFHEVNGVRVPRKAAQAGSSEDASMGGVTTDAEAGAAAEDFELPQLADTSDPLVFQSGENDFEQEADNFYDNASDDLSAENVPATAASDIEEVQGISDNPDEYALVKYDELYEDPVKNTELPSADEPSLGLPSSEDVAEESPLSFLSFPNATEYPLALSRDQEVALVAAHVSPLVLPAAANKPSRAEKKAAAKAKLAAPAPAQEPRDTFLAGLLSMPNGPGQDITARVQESNLVVLHVAPLVEPSSSKPGKMIKKAKKAAKLEQATAPPAPTNEETTVHASPVFETSPVAGTSPVEAPVIDDTVAEAHPFVEHDDDVTKNIEQPSTEDVDSSLSTDPFSPVYTPKSKRHGTPDSSQPSPGPITASNAPAALVRKANLATKTTLGIFSLEQFLDALEIEQLDQTTTKEDICTTFADCSAKEFEDIQKRAPDVVYSNFESPITQRKIKMGKTTLYGFLNAITFEDDIAPIQSVIDAFNNAASVSEDVSSKVLRALAG